MTESAREDVFLREVVDDDLPIFFEQQLDPDANRMAVFGAKDPSDRDAFMAKWERIRSDPNTTVKTIVFGGRVAGHIFRWRDEELGVPEVSYWLGKEFWGKGIATRALAQFLAHVRERPIYGRAAKDNVASLRVLEKCGFRRLRSHTAQGEEVEEVVLVLEASAPSESG